MILPDSGQRNVYASGAQRDNREGKGRYDLISPYALRRLARRLELGALKYSERNWEKGMPASRYVDALKRHTDELIMGDQREDHLGAILFNAMALAHTIELTELGLLDSSLNDLPYYEKEQESNGQ